MALFTILSLIMSEPSGVGDGGNPQADTNIARLRPADDDEGSEAVPAKSQRLEEHITEDEKSENIEEDFEDDEDDNNAEGTNKGIRRLLMSLLYMFTKLLRVN